MLSYMVVTRSGRGFLGYFPNRKPGRSVAWNLHCGAVQSSSQEFSRGVLFYLNQAIRVRYTDGLIGGDDCPEFNAILKDGSGALSEVETIYPLGAVHK